MKFRIATVTLAVALALWSSSAAFSQIEEDPLAPALSSQELDPSLQSELPLQGVLEDMKSDESTTQQASPARHESEWLYELRRKVNSTPRSKIAGAVGVFVALAALGFAVFAARKRARWRTYRRSTRFAGGSRSERLEGVVASVQFEQPKDTGPKRDRLAETEWPRSL